MANQLTLQRLLVGTSLAGPSKVTLLRTIIAQALAGSSKVTSQRVIAAQALAGASKVTGQQVVVAQALRGANKVAGQWLIVARSIHNAIFFNRLDSGQIFGVSEFDVEYTQALVPEFNPYRPTVPSEFERLGDEFFYFSRENQEIIRHQHNLSQAGDTTFPWQMLTECHTDKFVNLGSIGRFYHEQYGLIRARYVQFDKIDSNLNINAPAGLITSHTSLDWIVTNRVDLSDPMLPVGIIASYTMPTDGAYGWVVIEGAVPAEVFLSGSATTTLGMPLSWGTGGCLTESGVGRVIGRRVGRQTTSRLTPGVLKVEFESFSLQTLNQYITSAGANVAGRVTALEALTTNLGVTVGEHTDSIVSLESQIQGLLRGLANEATYRSQADRQLQEMIQANDGVSEAELNNAVTQLTLAIQQVQGSIGPVAEEALAKAIQALNLIAALPATDLSSIYAILSSLSDRIEALEAKPIVTLPMVDGSIPPNLMYLDDGSLIWVEIPYGG